MDRFTSIDATAQTLSAHLHPDERIILQQEGVGLYDGKDKSPPHYDGRLHLTSHRIIFLSSTRPHSSSAALDLSLVRQTEYWTGFLKSNPKITLLLAEAGTSPPPAAQTSSAVAVEESSSVAGGGAAATTTRNWVCRVCGMKNLPSAQLGAKCSLCGVARDRPSSSATPPSSSPIPSRTGTPRIDRDRYSSTPPPLPPPPPPQLAPAPIAEPTPTTTSDRRLPCPICTFLNHHSMANCEVCDSPLVPLTATASSLSRTSTPLTPAESTATGGGGASFVRLSFRKGGERAFYAALKEVLGKKEWDLDRGREGKGARGGEGAKAGNGGGGGIDAIMRGMDLDSRDRDDSLEDALKDLDALMSKAKEMITLAQSINERLSTSAPPSTSASDAPQTANNLASTSLASLGLISAPITADMISSADAYHHELAKELGTVLTSKEGGLMRNKGVMGLDEVWCLWNRARGVALVPPSSLSLCASHLPLYTHNPRITLRRFPSGLTILHTPQYSPRAFTARLLDLLDLRQALAESFSNARVEWGQEVEMERGEGEREGLTTLEVAKAEGEGGGVGVGLVKEMVEEVEREGQVVRDEQGGEGTRWFRNLMSGVQWDGQAF